MYKLKQSLLSVIIGLALVAGISYAAPWAGPTEVPPEGNVPAPINTGSSNQTFTGSKVIKMKDDNSGVFNLFGSLKINGQLQIVNGTEGAGKVLTSDASGLVSWKQGGNLPTGLVSFFNLSSCPSGWVEYNAAKGRYLVGIPDGGTLNAVVGTKLSDKENRATGRHTHDFLMSPVPTGVNTPLEGGYNQGGTESNFIGYAGDVEGTNAPYLQLLVCRKI